MIAIGDKAPAFKLKDHLDRSIDLAELGDTHIMLMFYPLDFTPT